MSKDDVLTPPEVRDIADLKETPILNPDLVKKIRERQPNEDDQRHKRPPGYFVLWVVTILSLLLNAVTLREILNLREFVASSLQETISTITAFQEETITYTFPVNETIIIDTEIPFDEQIEVPISEQVTVNTTAVATIADLPFIGEVTADVPVSATVPIEEVFVIDFERSFRITVPVDIELDVPIAIDISETELDRTLEDIKTRLMALNAKLNKPLFPEFSFGEK